MSFAWGRYGGSDFDGIIIHTFPQHPQFALCNAKLDQFQNITYGTQHYSGSMGDSAEGIQTSSGIVRGTLAPLA